MRRPHPRDLETIEWLAKIRWPHGIKCTFCGSLDCSDLIKTRGNYQCRSCRKQFSVLSKTLFQGTRLSPFELASAIIYFWDESMNNFYEDYWRGPIGVRTFSRGIKTYSTAQRLHKKLVLHFKQDLGLNDYIQVLLK